MNNKNLKIKHKMTKELLKLSKSITFNEALKEFMQIGEDPYILDDKQRCLCHARIRKAYIIENKYNGYKAIVGKKCLEMFELIPFTREDKKKFLSRSPKKIVNFKLLSNNMMIAEKLTNETLKEHEALSLCDEVIKKIGDDVFRFGKYKGCSVYDIVKRNRGYIKGFILSDKFKMKVDKPTGYLFVD